MSDLKPWVKPLKIPIKDYEEWTTLVPAGHSVTFWAMDKGKLKPQSYLLWAREHYQLPVLKDQFFKSHSDHELWTQIQSVANWSPEMVPLHQWDGIVYIGCVEPPQDVQWSFPVIYVLASARSLKNHWEKLQSKPQVEPSLPLDGELTATRTEAAFVEEAPEDHLASIQIPPVGTQIPEQVPSSEVELQIPKTIPKEANEDVPEGLQLNIPAKPLLDEPVAVKHDSSPEGLSFDFPTESVTEEGTSEQKQEANAPDGIQLGNIEFKLDLPENLEAVIENHATEPIPEQAPPQEFKLKFDVKEGPPEDPTFSDNTVTKFAITVSGINKKAPKGSVVDTENMAPHSAASAASDTELSAWLFNELRQYFKQSMVLLIDKDNLQPWKWENNWQPSSENAFAAFSPDQPGLFRILLKTKHPYHGYVVESELNKNFFKFWGFEALPGHVTAIPIQVDGQLTGMSLSIGNESAADETTLIQTEKLVSEFTNRLVEISSQAA